MHHSSIFSISAYELIPVILPFVHAPHRDFVYCHSVVGRAFARVDHFLETSPLFWEETPANVVHLPQNKFEIILRKEVLENTSAPAKLLFGFEAKKITYSATGTHLRVEKCKRGRTGPSATSDEDIEIRCDYLVAADGANSLVRQSLDISLKGEESMHTLMNIHFTCAGLLGLLMPRPAMLYFVFNEAVVAVFVAHDPEKNEWVCQIPIFPPFRNPEVIISLTCLPAVWLLSAHGYNDSPNFFCLGLR
jgi:2-polyprenyl-6-methoxyphenol hydroxylase-like FAD-dependent oxidoreductase